MKLHPRTGPMTKANIEIMDAVQKISKKYELTDYEEISILSGLISLTTKYAIRHERHGDTDTPGGIAPGV